MKLRIFELFDLILLVTMMLLITIGVVFIYSSSVNSAGISVSREYIRQIIFGATGLILMATAAILDYRKLVKQAPKLFIGMVLVLLYTGLFGKVVNGARSWLGLGNLGVQPSEFAKIIYIFFLAWYFERTDKVSDRKRFITSLCIMGVPLMLILLQPDLGTASVYIPIFLVMCFMAGIPSRYLFMVILTGVLTVVCTVLPVWESEILQRSIPILKVLTNQWLRLVIIAAAGTISLIGIVGYMLFKSKYYYWIAYCFGITTVALVMSIAAGKVLKPYQIQRLIIFIDPESDPLGAGWNIIQSKIAIGSGNMLGQGFLQGIQSHLRFLPQQSTDFIFSILSEEWGFVGGCVVFVLYLVILFRIISIIKTTKHLFGYYVASGILAMFFFHFIVNVGMVMGIMPITGIPLVFLSYGGSSLWTGMICIGILMSINFHQESEFVFS